MQNHDRLSPDGEHTTGWLVSIGLHGSLVLGAIVLFQQMQLEPRPKSFEWNVAMVDPLEAPSPAAAKGEFPPNQLSQAHPPIPAQKHPSAARVQPPPAPVESLHAASSPVQATTPAVEPTPPLPIPPQPVGSRSESSPQATVQTTAAKKPDPPVEAVRNEPDPQPPMPAKLVEATPTASMADIAEAPSAHSAEPLEHAPAALPPSAASRSPEPTPISPDPLLAQKEHPLSPAPSPNAVTPDTTLATPHPPVPAPTEVATLAPPTQPKAAKTDDGWLSELMGKWIIDLEKHYPATLRVEGVQGKVVLIAILHENGTLSDIRIAKSSGNSQLDQAAVADVEQGPPIKLSRPLGRPQRPIKFSINYDLKTAR